MSVWKQSVLRMVFAQELLPVFLPPTSAILSSGRGFNFSVVKKFEKSVRKQTNLVEMCLKISVY